ncbi:MAG: serine/threonine-protein kinase [Planctomycetota bacterium]|nr:serine/threonine-protein kinase [Planctomycetota bacterium]MDP6761881.1 serine/threonine-protein kinase [Planctomycetota bacterium]MDP6987953.1 serine/threonine-protein kinase [Planctomycetota bacterium]
MSEVFGGALEYQGEERARFVAEACGDDAALREEVEALLATDEALGGSEPAEIDLAGETTQTESTRSAGEEIGGFRLRRLLGVGGMGEVWEAEEAELARSVALKLMRPGASLERSVAFFEREARAGARLQHPGIVTVYGTGGEEGGERWISMELVAGARSLRDAVREASEADRLDEGHFARAAELVAEVAEAVECAHEAGVIHRDLKPSNILIDEHGRPRVADFGLARVTDEEALSVSGDFVGTYAYMSPEQILARRRSVDRRTDIFSLGVILYELACLRRPFEGDTSHQIAQKILHDEAPDPRLVRSKIPTDLAVICGKALEKSPDRRYPTMAEIAADLRRHLADEPIMARPPSTAELAVRWIRRHPARSSAVAVAAFAFAAISWLLVLNVRANRDLAAERVLLTQANTDLAAKTAEAERSATEAAQSAEEALRQARIAEEVNDFLNADLLAAVAPSAEAGRGKDVTMRAALDEAARRIEGRFPEEPLIEAGVRDTIAGSYFGLGEAAAAETHMTRAVELRTEALGAEHPETLAAVASLGAVLEELGRFEEAEQVLADGLVVARDALGTSHRATLTLINNLGLLLNAHGDPAAEALLLEGLEASRELLGTDHAETMIAVNNVGFLYLGAGDVDRAADYVAEALEIGRRVLGDEHPDTQVALSNLGSLRQRQGRLDEARAVMAEALEIGRRVLGDDHPDLVERLTNLGLLEKDLGDLDAAGELCAEALATSRHVLGPTHPTTLICINNLGTLERARGRMDEAQALMQEALGHSRAVLGDEHPDTLISIYNIAILLVERGDLPAAEPLLRECWETALRTLGEEDAITRAARRRLDAVLADQGR